MRIGIVVPHIFMHQQILPNVIFSPASLAIQLAENLESLGHDVTLYSPGPIKTKVRNVNADLSYFKKELKLRNDDYLSLLKKHPFTFVTLARQVQAELSAKAIAAANRDKLDLVHFYTNEEEIGLAMAELCEKPVVFTHHDPFNFLVKYKSVFPKYAAYNWLSLSFSQRRGMPKKTNWVGNIYHGLPNGQYQPVYEPKGNYIAYLGRIISSKGVHLAIRAVQQYNREHRDKVILKIAGKHYAEHKKDTYWKSQIQPLLKDPQIQYVGFIKTTGRKQKFLANAKALIIPSVYEEPFGLVMIEALACATPVIGLNSGAIPEVIKQSKTGLLVSKKRSKKNGIDDVKTISRLADAISQIDAIKRTDCRAEFEDRFSARQMAAEHVSAYEKLARG